MNYVDQKLITLISNRLRYIRISAALIRCMQICLKAANVMYVHFSGLGSRRPVELGWS